MNRDIPQVNYWLNCWHCSKVHSFLNQCLARFFLDTFASTFNLFQANQLIVLGEKICRPCLSVLLFYGPLKNKRLTNRSVHLNPHPFPPSPRLSWLLITQWDEMIFELSFFYKFVFLTRYFIHFYTIE